MDYAISMNNINKSFGQKQVISDVTIDIRQGELIGFLGPSGAGKTTIIRILTGQLKQNKGVAKILGKDSKTLNHEIYSQIGIVSDNSGLYESMNAHDNLTLFAKILNSDNSRVAMLLEKVGLKDHAKKQVKKFSRGMKQRLVLARAMLNNPKILFLDEPTSGLDPSTSVDVHKLMLDMKKDGTTFFLTTHNMTEAEKLCDRIALFNEGKVVELGTLDELSQKYNTEKRVKIRHNTGEFEELSLTAENSPRIAELISGNRIMNMHTMEPSLEQIFLKVTGRELS
jgi:ABC-2 type transport system ATP-binding protein